MMSQNPIIKYLTSLFNSVANLGVSPASSLTQRMRTKGLNIYCSITLVSAMLYLISQNSRATVFDKWYFLSGILVYAICLVLNAIEKYKYANLLFNVCTPLFILASVVFYGLGVDVTAYPTSILFVIICYPDKNDRNLLIVYNLICICIGLLYHYCYASVFLSTMNYFDNVFILLLNTSVISVFFLAIMIEFRKSRDHKETLISALLDKQSKSMEVSKDILQFTRVMSHDLKNQLQSIQGFQNFLIDEEELQQHKSIQKHLNIANAKVDSITSTLDTLSQFNRLVETDVSNEILDLTSRIRALNLSSGNRQVYIDTPLVTVEASKQKIDLILQTILEHGLLHNSSDSPTVRVMRKQNVDDVEIIFTDNGKGFSEQCISSIFLPYKRDGAFENSDWHLRFSMISSLISNLGWKIDLTSKLGRGSKFRLLIPKSEVIYQSQLNSY